MALFGALAEVERTGKEVAVGTATFTGDGTVEIAHPFQSVDAVLTGLAHEEGPAAPSVAKITHRVVGSTLEFAAWDADDVADTSEVSFTYVVVGRRRR